MSTKGVYQAAQSPELAVSGYSYFAPGAAHYVELKPDGTKQHWRKTAGGWWRKMPAWVDPDALHYFPWRPMLRHSCAAEPKANHGTYC